MSARNPSDHGASAFHGGFVPPTPTGPGAQFPDQNATYQTLEKTIAAKATATANTSRTKAKAIAARDDKYKLPRTPRP